MTAKEAHFLCHRDELAPGHMRGFVVDGKDVVLCRKGDEFTALADRCSHQGAKLSGGALGGTNIACGVGQYKFVRGGEVIECPRHGYEYGTNDGRSLFDPRFRVKSYAVVIRGEDVLVEL